MFDDLDAAEYRWQLGSRGQLDLNRVACSHVRAGPDDGPQWAAGFSRGIQSGYDLLPLDRDIENAVLRLHMSVWFHENQPNGEVTWGRLFL